MSNRTQSVVLNGAQSDPLPVVSGVPQGSVLGPLLFLVYIDGITSSVSHSKVTIFADDIALYKIIMNPRDYTYLQADISSISTWISTNELTLNFLKCCYMLFSRKRQPTLPANELFVGDSHALAQVSHYKYLGIHFSSDLSWSYHIDQICKRTRKLVGMLYRNFYQFSSSPTLAKLYKSLIRPHLEYACTVWDPHLRRDIQAIENVQKFALRVCSKSWNTDYNSLLDTLNISTLSARRTSLKLCLLFKMLTEIVDYPFCPFTRRHTPYANRHLNTVQLTVPHAHTNQFKYSFFPSATERWNSLDFDTCGISSRTSFRFVLANH